MSGPLRGWKADIVARLHLMRLGAETHGNRAFEHIHMLFLEDVVVRGRGLPARLQLLDRDPDAVILPARSEGQVLAAHPEARHVVPFRPRNVLGRDRLWQCGLFGRHGSTRSVTNSAMVGRCSDDSGT